ncbi:hypothetical protein Mgra_00003744 [Meloidogyne graminicola]|uniref:BTB domain-containing protein n=1 Tax=Meloidogyne graminicola TaxID=189291 RepID=A0A8S9ZUD0_9BILA|nr:hypothetical protein Mgra_00003744 [Meloidogyne graminicola]
MFIDETKLEFVEAKIEWTINDVEKLGKHMKPDEYLTSNCFYNYKCHSVLWKLIYYPNCPRVVLIQTGLNGVNNCLKVEYEIFGLTTNDTRFVIAKNMQEFKHKTETGKHNIDLSRLRRNGGSLLLGCTIEFLLSNLKIEHSENESSFNLKDFYFNMFKQETFSDCVIKIGNELINAHRIVLAGNSNVFCRMFEQSGMVEAQNGIVKIDDCTPECFRAMLEYCYTGSITKSILETLAEDLFAVADKYELVPLKDKCEHFMASIISDKNISQCFRIVHIYNSTILENAISNYVRANRKTFLRSEEWKKLNLDYPNLAIQLLACVIEKIDK